MVRGFFDGASRGNPGEACAGAFLEDGRSEPLGEGAMDYGALNALMTSSAR